jgi:ribosomal protein L29
MIKIPESKEELLQELADLKLEYQSLKAKYEGNIAVRSNPLK